MKKKPEVEKDNSERWMLTYLDMITLLFVTFVVLYAMSVVDKAKFEAVAESLSSAFGMVGQTEAGSGTGQGKVPVESPQKIPAVPVQSKSARTLAYDNVYTLLRTEIKAGKLSVLQEERGLVVQLGSNFFFSKGSAELPSVDTSALIALAQALASIANEIQIEGFADPDELASFEGSPPFSTDWQLAAQRAVNLLDFLQSQGVPPDRLRAVSFGSSKAVASNNTEEGRAYNRHVDILILYDQDVTVTQ